MTLFFFILWFFWVCVVMKVWRIFHNVVIKFSYKIKSGESSLIRIMKWSRGGNFKILAAILAAVHAMSCDESIRFTRKVVYDFVTALWPTFISLFEEFCVLFLFLNNKTLMWILRYWFEKKNEKKSLKIIVYNKQVEL